MNMEPLKGVIRPIVTPFTSDGELHEGALRKEIGVLLDAGVHGLSIGGSTGEGAVLTDDELARGVQILREENSRGVPVICGVIRNSTRDAVRAGKAAGEAGAEALMVTPTHYHGTDAEGNYAYYRDISEAVGLPIIIYNVVQTNPIDPEQMVRLSDIQHVVGIKQSAGGIHGLNAMISACGDRTLVFGAQDDLLFCSYLLGAVGAISAILTVFPRLCVEQWDAVQSGDVARAREISFQLFPVWQIVMAAGMAFPGRIKALLRLLGRDAGVPRGPILEPATVVVDQLRAALQEAGLLDDAGP